MYMRSENSSKYLKRFSIERNLLKCNILIYSLEHITCVTEDSNTSALKKITHLKSRYTVLFVNKNFKKRMKHYTNIFTYYLVHISNNLKNQTVAICILTYSKMVHILHTFRFHIPSEHHLLGHMSDKYLYTALYLSKTEGFCEPSWFQKHVPRHIHIPRH